MWQDPCGGRQDHPCKSHHSSFARVDLFPHHAAEALFIIVLHASGVRLPLVQASKMILGRVAKKEAGQCEAGQGWMRGAGEYSISLEWCRNWYLTVVASYSGLVSECIFF